ncbi:hypothetical protein SUGI_0083830 [Cryptomeria japonica]|nr:hypothetical protein SUGI_0083830 [Cryptomeria japonica]
MSSSSSHTSKATSKSKLRGVHNSSSRTPNTSQTTSHNRRGASKGLNTHQGSITFQPNDMSERVHTQTRSRAVAITIKFEIPRAGEFTITGAFT